MDLAIGPMPERRAAAPASSRLTERVVLQMGVAFAASFLMLSLVSGVVPVGGLHGWTAIHLALAGATTVAIGTFMPHFGVTLAGTRPEPVGRRLGGVLALYLGMLGVALGRPLLGDRFAAAAGVLVLAGLAITAWNTYAPMRSGLARRHPIVQLTYAVALGDLVLGASLAILFLFGLAPVVSEWAALKPAHAWLNVLGFVSLTIAGTLIYLFPTMLGTRIRPHPSMMVAVLGLLVGPPLVALSAALTLAATAVVGGVITLLGAVGLLGYGLETWGRRGRWANDLAWHELTARHALAGMAWFVVTVTALVVGLVRDGVAVPGWTLGSLAVPLIGGWTLQELVAAWGHLLPAVGPGDMEAKARQRDLLSRFGPARVVAWNVGLVALWAGFGFGVPLAIAAGALLFGGAALTALGLLLRALSVTGAWRPARSVAGPYG